MNPHPWLSSPRSSISAEDGGEVIFKNPFCHMGIPLFKEFEQRNSVGGQFQGVQKSGQKPDSVP